MRNLIVGYGEIGKAVGAVVGVHAWVDKGGKIPEGEFDVLHVCFPYSESFVKDVREYVEQYKPHHIIIYSTVPIGTTAKIPGAVHSPVEGKHPDLEMSIRFMERWVGVDDMDIAPFYKLYFGALGLYVRIINGSHCTEALKLLSTTEYGLNIEFARYKKYVADKIGMDFELTKDWNIQYNKLYQNLGMGKRLQKFVLDAPEGPKGGHCVTPNAVILNDQFPNKLVEIVGEVYGT